MGVLQSEFSERLEKYNSLNFLDPRIRGYDEIAGLQQALNLETITGAVASRFFQAVGET